MKILVVADHYLPGCKAGGPIRTLANMVEWLGDEFQFYILTSDRDLGDRQPYADVVYGEWCHVGRAKVRYLSPRQLTGGPWLRMLRTIDYDVLYLNGVFSPATRRTLFLRWWGLIPNKPVVLAPRGEFSTGAIRLKRLKKRVYLWLTKLMRLYRGVLWQASSQYEKQDILGIFNGQLGDRSIFIASNLPSRLSPVCNLEQKPIKQSRSARIVFLSRIARKKNLEFALDLLGRVNGNVEFDIYGPIEDRAYWQECQVLIKRLPSNAKVAYKGVVRPEQVRDIFGQYHLFLFPTRGENFGHVILEALGAGCPVLVSDQTPWRSLAEQKAGWDVPLSEPEQFRAALNELVSMDNLSFEQWSRSAREHGKAFAENPTLVEANRELFLKALTR